MFLAGGHLASCPNEWNQEAATSQISQNKGWGGMDT